MDLHMTKSYWKFMKTRKQHKNKNPFEIICKTLYKSHEEMKMLILHRNAKSNGIHITHFEKSKENMKA